MSHPDTVIVGTLTSHSHQYRAHLDLKINREISELKCTTEQMEFIDIYRVFHPTDAEHTFSQEPMKLSP
jgi:hypothetical protein